MKYFFRHAGLAEIPEIQALARRIWNEAYSDILSKEQIGYMLEMMYSTDVITEEILKGVVWDLILADSRPCGYLSYTFAEENSVKLSKIYIEKDFRGTSLAKESLNRVRQYAARNGKDYVFLTVNKNNKMAIRAYEKNGFEITASVVTEIGRGFVMDDYIMKCHLKAGER